jgi:hypothetical protein
MGVVLEVDTSRPAAAKKRSSPSIDRGNQKQPEATRSKDDPERPSNFSQQVSANAEHHDPLGRV